MLVCSKLLYPTGIPVTMPEGLALDADAISIPNNAPPASQLQAFDANAFDIHCMPAAVLSMEPHHASSNCVSPVTTAVSPSGEYLHIWTVMSPLHIFRDAVHNAKLNL